VTHHPELVAAIETATGSSVVRTDAVRGGDFAAAYRVELSDGRSLFAKTHSSPPPGFFTTEATGLEWLRAAQAVHVPRVIDVRDATPAMLLLDWIDIGRPRGSTDAEFGRALAAMHNAGAPSFGREDRRTTGSRALPNDPCATWSEFYATRRLLPLARLARQSGSLAPTAISALERLADNLSPFDDGEPPSRLHGDLWAGNRVIDVDGRSWLIDPAAHGGHREFDLAMMRLFGGFGADCFAGYEEVQPLRAGWRDRVSLHQIAPLVVHAIKFGGHYVEAATSAIERY